MKKQNIPKKPDFLLGKITGVFIPIKQKFNSRSHARQELLEWKKNGWISNYKIAWNTQLRMTVEVVLGDTQINNLQKQFDNL
jgi:hypothetical protein